MLAKYLLELSLIEYKMLKYKPSLLGASAIYCANKMNNICAWTSEME